MKLYIQVKPNAKVNKIEKMDESHFKVQVKAPPKDGKANQAVVDVLSDFFDLPKSRFLIVRGENAKTKVVEINNA